MASNTWHSASLLKLNHIKQSKFYSPACTAGPFVKARVPMSAILAGDSKVTEKSVLADGQ